MQAHDSKFNVNSKYSNFISIASLSFSDGFSDITFSTDPSVFLTTNSPLWDMTFPVHDPITSYNSGLSFFEEDIEVSIVSGNSKSGSVTYTCSLSGTPSVEYYVMYTDFSQGPDWFTIDPEQGTYEITAPKVSSDTNYTLM